MFLASGDYAVQRGDRWVLNGRYYRFAVNTYLTFRTHVEWRDEIELREVWAEREPSRTRRQDRPQFVSIANESDWGIVETEHDYELWWYFMNEHDALLFKLRWC